MADFLNALNTERTNLPKTIIYSLNPNDNQAIGTILGCFQDSTAVAKIQQGSAWWFNDHKTGMQDQMISLANLGNLSGFRRHADRLQKLLILHPSRLLPQNSLQPDRRTG